MQKLQALETSEPLYFLFYETLVLKSGSQEEETVPCISEIQYHCVEFSVSPNDISPWAVQDSPNPASSLLVSKSCCDRSLWFLWWNLRGRFSRGETDTRAQHLLHAPKGMWGCGTVPPRVGTIPREQNSLGTLWHTHTCEGALWVAPSLQQGSG